MRLMESSVNPTHRAHACGNGRFGDLTDDKRSGKRMKNIKKKLVATEMKSEAKVKRNQSTVIFAIMFFVRKQRESNVAHIVPLAHSFVSFIILFFV